MTVHYKVMEWDEDYRVGSDGSFWSKKRDGVWKKRKLSSLSRKDPRQIVCVVIKGKRICLKVSYLVLEAFVGPRPEGMEVCHFPNRDVTDNHLENLRWDTRKNNFKDRDFHGTTARGERSGRAKMTEWGVYLIRHTWEKRKETDPHTVRKLADFFEVDHTLIYSIVHYLIWRHI